MDSQDQSRTHISGHESHGHGVHLCHKCGWPFPNPHPSAKHRRAHKKICGTIEGYKLSDSEGHTHLNASDDEHLSDDDHKTPNVSGPNALETGNSEKGNGGIGEKLNRSEDEVFSDAVADFSDSGLSSGIEGHLRDSLVSATSMERVDRKDPKFSEPFEDKGFDGVSQLTVKSSDDCHVQNPRVLQSEGVEVGKTLELQGQPSGSTVEPFSSSVSDLMAEASTVVLSDDSLGLSNDSHLIKAEAMSDVIPENTIYAGENMTDCSLTSVAKKTNLEGMDKIESDRDMVEIVVSSNNVVGEMSEELSKIEVNDDGEGAGDAVKLMEKNSVEFPSVVPQDDLSLEVDSIVKTSASKNGVQVESEHVLQLATSSNLVKTLQEKGEENVIFYTPKPDAALPQSELEDCKGHEVVLSQNPLSLPSSESLKHKEDELKETVTEEYHSKFNSSQLSDEKEVLSPNMHVLDDTIKQGWVNCEPMVEEVIAEEKAEVSPVKHTVDVDVDERSIKIGTSVDSMKSEMNESCMVNFSGKPESDGVCRNLLEGSVMVSSEKFEDFKDCEGAVSQNPLNLHSSEALKDKEDDLKDTVTEESHSNFKLSQLSKESEVLPPDMHVFDNSIRQEQVNYEPMVEDIHPEEQAEVSPVKLTVESNQRSDEIGASVNAMNTEMNESHVAHFSGEQKSDDVIKTSKEINFPEGNVMASTNKKPRDVSVGFATSQTSILSIDNISHHEKNRNEIDDVAVDGKCRGANEESNIGIRMETLQPSNLLQLEVKPSSDVFKSDDAGEKGKIEKCDITDTRCKEGPIVKDISLANSGSSHFESPIVSGDVMDGDARKSKGIDCTNIDALSGTREDIKEDEINNSTKVQEEVGAFSNLPQAQDAEILLKAVENYARKHSSHSPLNTEHSAQYVSAVEDNQAVEPSGEPSGIIAVPVQDQSGNDLVKLGSSGIDASVNSSSRCDSLEGNWGSVSVRSLQSDAPAVIDGEALLASTEPGKSNLTNPKAAPEGQRSEKSEMFEPPSFMTLVEPGHVVGPKAAASEVQKGQNPQQSNSNSSQAGWFPTLTQVVNDSQGRKKNEEIIAKVTNWSTSKQHTPLKSLLGEAARSNKPNSPKSEENLANQKNGKVQKDNGSGLTTVNSILGPESPAAQALKGDAGKEWNSPARYPAEIKREKRKVKNRPYWIQFVCCSSVDPQ